MREIKIETIEQYLTWVRNCKIAEVPIEGKESLPFEQYNLYFRGQADKGWKLEPSVFRRGYDEPRLLRDACRHAWKYLQNYPSDLEKMIVLQHYGLPTRLLDLTSNPLIALYFACSDEKKKGKDGKVYCYCANGEETDRIPSVIASIVMKNTFDPVRCNDNYKHEIICMMGLLDTKCEKFTELEKIYSHPHFFLSPYNNDRITAQRGAFIIAPLITDEPDNVKSNYKKIEEMEGWHENKAIIDAKSKKQILQDLALLGVDQSTIFPDMDHLLRFLSEQHLSQSNIKAIDTD